VSNSPLRMIRKPVVFPIGFFAAGRILHGVLFPAVVNATKDAIVALTVGKLS